MWENRSQFPGYLSPCHREILVRKKYQNILMILWEADVGTCEFRCCVEEKEKWCLSFKCLFFWIFVLFLCPVSGFPLRTVCFLFTRVFSETCEISMQSVKSTWSSWWTAAGASGRGASRSRRTSCLQWLRPSISAWLDPWWASSNTGNLAPLRFRLPLNKSRI